VVGSVNPGGEVLADGSVFVWGALKGRAFAGIGAPTSGASTGTALQVILQGASPPHAPGPLLPHHHCPLRDRYVPCPALNRAPSGPLFPVTVSCDASSSCAAGCFALHDMRG